MNAVAILIVVVAGFLFTSRYPLAKFKQIRSSGWAFYLHAFAWGTVFCFLAGIILLAADYFDWLSRFARMWQIDLAAVLAKIQTPLEYIKWFVWSFLSLMLAWLSGYTTSKIPTIRRKASKKVSQENEFEQMLYDATASSRLILVSLSSRKVYVGFVLKTSSSDNLNKTEFFSILPLFSGYREKDTLSLHLPTNYERFYQSLTKDGQHGSWDELNRFRVVLSTSQVMMISYFDLTAHQEISKEIPQIIQS